MLTTPSGMALRSQPAPKALTPSVLLSVTATRSPRLPAFRTHNASGATEAFFIWFLGKLFIIEDHKLLGPIPKEYQILKSISLQDPPAQLPSTRFPFLSASDLQNHHAHQYEDAKHSTHTSMKIPGY